MYTTGDRYPDRTHPLYQIQRCRVSFQSDYGERHPRLRSGTVCVHRNRVRSSPETRGNDMFEFADDSSLVIPASNAHTRERELEHIQQWASENKLSLNKSKSQEIIFRKPRSRGTTDVPIIPGIQRVNSLKIIGVTLCSNLLDARARFIRHQFICPVIIRAPGTKNAWIRRPVTADSVPSHGQSRSYNTPPQHGGVHKRPPTRLAGIIPSEGCKSWLPQKQLANTECYMRGSRRQAVP